MNNLITKCIIIDDEPLAIELIENHISKLDHFEITATFRNPTKAFLFLKTNPVDLIFLDIQMPGLSGLDFLKLVTDIPPVIFTTAYREFALESYDFDVIDYLLKPITFERFFKAIDKYFRRQPLVNQTQEISSEYLYVKADRKYQKINFSDVLFVESKKDYIKIRTSESSIIIKEKIGDFIKSLPETSFLRVHRSYIVNVNNLTAFTHNDVEIGNLEIPIGGTYKDVVIEKLSRFK